uniref:Uncharacterized protein n=1 Tax=Arundo donax TaxID=35708 RepID=A0A0A9A294_ARUDO
MYNQIIYGSTYLCQFNPLRLYAVGGIVPVICSFVLVWKMPLDACVTVLIDDVRMLLHAAMVTEKGKMKCCRGWK